MTPIYPIPHPGLPPFCWAMGYDDSEVLRVDRSDQGGQRRALNHLGWGFEAQSMRRTNEYFFLGNRNVPSHQQSPTTGDD